MVVVSRGGGLEISTGCGLRLWVGVMVANSGPHLLLWFYFIKSGCFLCYLEMNDNASIISGNIVLGYIKPRNNRRLKKILFILNYYDTCIMFVLLYIS